MRNIWLVSVCCCPTCTHSYQMGLLHSKGYQWMWPVIVFMTIISYLVHISWWLSSQVWHSYSMPRHVLRGGLWLCGTGADYTATQCWGMVICGCVVLGQITLLLNDKACWCVVVWYWGRLHCYSMPRNGDLWLCGTRADYTATQCWGIVICGCVVLVQITLLLNAAGMLICGCVVLLQITLLLNLYYWFAWYKLQGKVK